MRSPKGAIVPYKPEPVPADLPPSAQRYLDNELNRIAGLLQSLLAVLPSTTSFSLEPTYTAPAGPTIPQMVYADGTKWDPGSGPGFYYWNGMVWTPLG